MKIPRSPKLDEFEKNLLEMNGKQVRAVRHEAETVKSCFTNQAHQAMVASATIAVIIATILKGEFNPYVVALGSFLISGLCITVARVGCHKYATANRVSAYQIHLSRIIDYQEESKLGLKVADELRRIDWEEAMFAWRIVQPKIYHFFYLERESLGICFKRNDITWISRSARILVNTIQSIIERMGSFMPIKAKLFRRLLRRKDSEDAPDHAQQRRKAREVRQEQIKSIRKYPWFDTNELIQAYCDKEEGGLEIMSSVQNNEAPSGMKDRGTVDKMTPQELRCTAKGLGSELNYHPGTYLRKKLLQLHWIALLSLFFFIVCLLEIASTIELPVEIQVAYGWGLLVSGIALLLILVLRQRQSWIFNIAGIFYVMLVGFQIWKSVLVPMCQNGFLAEFIFLLLGLLVAFGFVRGILANRWRSRILESGLLSIQTSAFVWRIVCICQLVAKQACSNRINSSRRQLFNGYTIELHKTSIWLWENLHRVHDWLASREEELQSQIPARETLSQSSC